jgi:orotidine-5'-phosphate decarboxylase
LLAPGPILSPRERLVVALDVPTAKEALLMAERLSGRVGMLKVGLELFCAEGPAFVRDLQAQVPVFLDLKLHDIPTTVRRALEAVLKLNPRLVNVHTQGGPAMLEAAVEAVRVHRAAGGHTELLAVTVLTSLDREALAALGHAGRPEDLALAYAKLAQQAGCAGVVCSAWEAAAIRDACGEGFHRLTPGIRPAGSASQDQARVMTPAQALKQGSTWLVVGRPITHAVDPAAAAEAIVAEMQA